MSMQRSYESTVDNLFSATQVQPVVAGSGTILAGHGELVRGTLLTTDDGVKYSVVQADQDVFAVLAQDVDATSDVDAPLYFTGEFNKAALTVGEGTTVDQFLLSARKAGIFIKENIA